MPIFETFTKRQKKREQTGQQDVYQYDNLPPEFRVQIIHIWNDAIGFQRKKHVQLGSYYVGTPAEELWRAIHDALSREKGVFDLGNRNDHDYCSRCRSHLLTADLDDSLNIIELSFRAIDRIIREDASYKTEVETKLQPDDAIEELNARFREHGIGYQYEQGELIRIDSHYVHAEAVVPALSLLQDAAFRGPSEEFLRAHEHYRKGDFKEAIVNALKAFESTMKAICDARGWKYDPTATASVLITHVTRSAYGSGSRTGRLELMQFSKGASKGGLVELGLESEVI